MIGAHLGAEPARLRVLGAVDLCVGDCSLPLSDLERGLLALTAFRRQVTADDLADWLWGDAPPASMRNRVQGLVSSVRRKAGGAPVLLTAGRGYRLGPDVDVDHQHWTAMVRRARDLTAKRPAESIAAYDSALTLFGDHPLDGLPPTARIELERDRLVQERLRAVQERLAVRIDSGRSESAVVEASALAAQHPFHEGILALYVLALGAAGRQREALDVYRAARERLAAELGIEPSAQLRSAHERVLRGDVPLLGGPRPAETDGTGPDPTAASPVLPIPQTLPRPVGGFVGRESELAAIAAAAERAGERAAVVSITGLTGVGKSALALEAGARLRSQFTGGSLYADLSATRDGGVAEELGNFLRLLGVLADAVPDDLRSRAGMFRSLIAGRQLLIVLDNVDAGGEVDPRLTELLPATPGSFALITSRVPVDRLDPTERIRLNGLPDADAVALLTQAAGPERIAADPDAVRGLVRHTGALPLALRLLGARLSQRPDLTVRRLARGLADTERGLGVLDDAAAPESSLRASLSMAWNRLPEPAQLVARLLAALPLDAFTAWVPEALAADEAAGERAMDALIEANFVEPVLLPRRAVQYRMHDLVIRFAREQEAVPPDARIAALQAVGRAQLERLAGYHGLFPLQFLPLPPGVARPVAASESFDPDEVAGLLLTELATARGCARALAAHDTALAWRLLAACENGHRMSPEQEAWATAVDSVNGCLDAVRDDDRLGAAILALCRAWHLQDALGQYGPALNLAAQARRELTLLGAVEHAMAAGIVGAYSALALSDRALTEEKLAHVATGAVRVENPVLTGWRHIVQGELHNDYDELEDSEREFVRARQVLADTGEQVGYAYATAYLSRALRRQGKLGPARILADEALADFARLGADHAYTVALDARAEVGVELGHGEEALEQATNALTRARAAQDAFITARATRTRGRALRQLGRLGEAAVELRVAIEQFAALNRTLSLAATLHDLALVQDLMGERAAAGETLRQERAAQQQARLATDPARAETR